MTISLKTTAFVFLMISTIACFCPLSALRAQEDALPESVGVEADDSLTKVGQGTYRKLGFRIYDASLWAVQNTWDAEKPYALQLRYARDLSKETLVDTVMDDIADQDIADEATRAQWRGVLNAALSDVVEGDMLTGLAVPGKKSLLFYNGVAIASIEDQAFSDAFFGIWLGKDADEDLRQKLLGGTYAQARADAP